MFREVEKYIAEIELSPLTRHQLKQQYYLYLLLVKQSLLPHTERSSSFEYGLEVLTATMLQFNKHHHIH